MNCNDETEDPGAEKGPVTQHHTRFVNIHASSTSACHKIFELKANAGLATRNFGWDQGVRVRGKKIGLGKGRKNSCKKRTERPGETGCLPARESYC